MNIEIVDIPKIEDYRGTIAVVEGDLVPFEMKRVYYLYDVPSTAKRGGHAHKAQMELLVPLSGSFEVLLFDGKTEQTIVMNKPNKGLLIKNNIWRELDNFSAGSVCMVISSGLFDEEDYIRNYENFMQYVSDKY